MVTKTLTRALSVWMALIILLVVCFNFRELDQIKVGPNADLRIFGILIDTGPKYAVIICYCVANSALRTLTSNIVSPWVINNVQDDTRDVSKPRVERWFAYEITLTTTLYHWFDWYIYMTIMLSQIDMIFIEIIADVVTSAISTTYFLKKDDARRISASVAAVAVAAADDEESELLIHRE